MSFTSILSLGDQFSNPDRDWVVLATSATIRAHVLRQHLNIQNLLLLTSGFAEDLDKSEFEDVGDYARATADGKARAVAQRVFGASTPEEVKAVLEDLKNPFGSVPTGFDISKVRFVIGADTVCSCAGEIFEKPANIDEARKQFTAYQNAYPEMITGVSAYAREKGHDEPIFSFYESTVLRFQRMTPEDIEAYLRTNEFVGTAGSCRITGFAESLIEWMDGSYTTSVGMPAQKVSRNLCRYLTGFVIEGEDEEFFEDDDLECEVENTVDEEVKGDAATK
ncbi:Maf-like protein family protein, putative [Babesia bigemina]|uniref:Maf-like protein family protein, putative n=1 Tax=Babesia bigemina TaxID=5866 RepID=A0A061D9N8_BABBI|nr:Maf-like protein family protein, putative [Babesia bigemina]CDR96692.1 Maf-like protein family protein, putative [Babesia bigemina]|eukprot:XP_012768878.1 Maf-like protein family protein, putative [Babesia bigemina]